MSVTESLPAEFARIVSLEFEFLVRELGFLRTRTDDWLVHFESTSVYVDVFRDSRALEAGVTIGLVTVARQIDRRDLVQAAFVIGRPVSDDEYSLDEVLTYQPSTAVEADMIGSAFVSSIPDMESWIPRLASSLRRCCRQLLLGDPDAFAQMRDQRSVAGEAFMAAETLSACRRAAHAAWQQRNYHAVVQALEAIRSRLTPAEEKKLQYARRLISDREPNLE